MTEISKMREAARREMYHLADEVVDSEEWMPGVDDMDEKIIERSAKRIAVRTVHMHLVKDGQMKLARQLHKYLQGL